MEQDFLAAMIDKPDGDSPRLVFADGLDKHDQTLAKRDKTFVEEIRQASCAALQDAGGKHPFVVRFISQTTQTPAKDEARNDQ